ncbi:MAG: hypothetical protein HYZ57_08685 [Acidobacteria bacterium]|nr:hypothetical protein [Acidobacteriota bacterium]MBI3279901.1 hypothetical protein [Acidobacteriota bacterium]
MPKKFTRRELAVTVVSATALMAQVQPPKPASGDEQAGALAQVRRNSEQLSKQNVPIATEPAFAFVP